MMTKKVWQRPELVVLVRSMPEEAVLGNCKGTGGTSRDSLNGGCYQDNRGACGRSCNNIVTS
jgi:hypothetical protein